MVVQIIEDTERKREIVERCDTVFSRPITVRDDYEAIFSRIDRNALFLAALEGPDVVGYAAMYMDHDTKAGYITMLGVMANMQSKGVGSALMQRCVEEAAENGMICVRLEVYKKDAAAITFYDHWGFEFEKECSEESIYMAKKLSRDAAAP